MFWKKIFFKILWNFSSSRFIENYVFAGLESFQLGRRVRLPRAIMIYWKRKDVKWWHCFGNETVAMLLLRSKPLYCSFYYSVSGQGPREIHFWDVRLTNVYIQSRSRYNSPSALVISANTMERLGIPVVAGTSSRERMANEDWSKCVRILHTNTYIYANGVRPLTALEIRAYTFKQRRNL